MQRKREQEFGWEDITDSAFMPLPQPLQSRFWRAPERLYRYSEGRKPAEIITFDQYNAPFVQIVGQRYRKRIGRGGRIHLDRLTSRRVAPDSSDDEGGPEREEVMQRMKERWRYDADIPQELPSSRYPMVLDDFDTKFSATRSRMLAASDWESVYPATVHIEEAMRWTMREPDRPPPMQVIGKLPGQRIPAFGHPHGGMNGANGAAVPVLPSAGGNRPPGVGPLAGGQQPGGGGAGGGGQMSVPGRRASQGKGGGGTSSPQPVGSAPSPGLPQQAQIRRLMWENGNTG